MKIEINVTVTDGKYGHDSVTVNIPAGISRKDPKERPSVEALQKNTSLRGLIEDTEQNLIDAIQEYTEKTLGIVAKVATDDGASDAE